MAATRARAVARIPLLVALACAATTAAHPSWAAALEYQVDTSQVNWVRFISDAPIEDFEGTTPQIDGFVFWEGDTLTAGQVPEKSELYFEVPLATLKTGIDMRDRHMRDNYLHTDRHPYVAYKAEITGIDAGGGDTLQVATRGKLELHGKSKDYELVCTVTGSPESYAVSAQFDIRLTDFDIEVPSFMFLKISEVIQVRVNVHVAPVD